MADQSGHLHPLTIIQRRIATIFGAIGFELAEGPDIETEYYNFDALNIPPDHPARDLWDTFWLKEPKDRLLRTHTSPVQIHYMETHEPPIRIIAMGKCFRHEATDATHEAQFFQLEGLVIDRSTSLSHLKGTLEHFFHEFFGGKIKTRLRPSFFPFVEPGVEVDMTCFKCGGNNDDSCSVCKGTGWVEIMGAGMVHPKVLENVGYDPREFQGYAFGVGIERLAMLKYGIPDVRILHNGDLKVVNQF